MPGCHRTKIALLAATAVLVLLGVAGCQGRKQKSEAKPEPPEHPREPQPDGAEPPSVRDSRPEPDPGERVTNEIKEIKRGRIRVPADHFPSGSAKTTRTARISATTKGPANTAAPAGPKTVDLYYERYQGPKSLNRPLILLHGGPGNPMPAEQILRRSHLGRVLLAHYDIVYFEQRGTGRSLTADERDKAYVRKHIHRYSIHQYVADIEAVRRHIFGPKQKVALMGSSWGGYLGLAYALAFPQHLDRVILGSFEATARSTTDLCANFDRALTVAEHEYPGLRQVMEAFRAAVKNRRVVQRPKGRRPHVVRLTDLIELASPFAIKARYHRLAGMLTLVLKNDQRGADYMNKLKLETTRVTIGGSVPATATYCETLVDKPFLEQLRTRPAPTMYCDNKGILSLLDKTCRSFSGNTKHFDAHHRLNDLKIPALVFAGRWDPLVPWQATARTAAQMPDAAFLLLPGGHTPIKAGGRCFAEAVNRFAQGRTSFDRSCFQQPAR